MSNTGIYTIRIKTDYISLYSGIAGGGKWGHAPRGASTHLFCPLKSVLSRNFDQSMLKNGYFGEKTVKISSASGLCPRTPFASGGWGRIPQTPALILSPAITTVDSSILTHKMRFIAPSKKKK